MPAMKRTRVQAGLYKPIDTAYFKRVEKRNASRRASYQAPAKAVVVVPGRTRTSGFYGRMTGPGATEMKFRDDTLNFTFDSTGEIPATGGQLSLIPQGDTESTRDGRQATIKSIQIRGALTLTPGASATLSNTVYMFLVLDKQCNGAAAAVTDVQTGSNFGVSLRNLENNDRFDIIKKWTWDFNPVAGVSGAFNTVSKHMDYYKKLNIPITWSGTTGAITEIRSNNLFLMAGCISTGDDLVTFSGTSRIRFVG